MFRVENFLVSVVKRGLFLAAAFACIVTVATAPALAQRQTPQQAVTQFLNNPSELLGKAPNGGPELVSAVRDLVTTDPATLQLILNQLANANKDQKSAIGAGLAQAAKIVVRTNPGFANEIQQAILNTKDQDVVLAFAAGAGDRPIGAAGGGAPGGASGGQTSPLSFFAGGAGGPAGIGGPATNTPFFSYTSSVVPATNNSTLATNNTLTTSVSP
jgi:hypothetical protein